MRYAVHPDVYDPSDDSFLLFDALHDLAPGRLIEVGTGSGILAIRAAQLGHDAVGCDLSPVALALARANARLNEVRVAWLRCDLLQGLRPERADAIVFNPPYLPTDSHERLPGPLNLAFDGGPDGFAVLDRFLAQVPVGPEVLLVVSSLQDEQHFDHLVQTRGFDARRHAERPYMQERLSVWRMRRRPRKA